LRDVERETGISVGNISGWENGKNLPSAKALLKLAKLYNISIDWILRGEEAFSDQNLVKDIFACSVKNKYEWVLIEAIAALAKKETAQFAFQAYLAEQDDPIIKGMIKYLKTTWDCGDEKTRNWLEIQFQQSFPKYKKNN
jgi:transcriptional regulator with XRE-family HTH domain